MNKKDGLKNRFQLGVQLKKHLFKREPGIDGILVTVGLCIIALVLCLAMKDSLKPFVTTIIGSMQQQANDILSGAK